MRDCRNILWMILSKRPGNMARMLPSDWGDGYENCWLGVTVETQHETRRFASLLRVPSVRYWCSGEPLLEAVDFSPWLGPDKISWLIIGGETHNSHPRPLDPAWCYDLHEQCDRAGAMVWQKQMHGRSQADAKAKIPADLIRLERPPLV
jgi:protein gp37